MTDSSGFPIGNTHNGDTTILGDLNVEGSVTIQNVLGQSEYLDSGDYNPIVLGVPLQWNSLSLKAGTQARYAKNGNVVEVYMELTGSLKANQPFAQISVTVPSVDLFDKKHTGSAYSDSVFILSSNAQVYNCTGADITTSGGGSTSVLLNYDSYISTNPISAVDFFVNITYKLEGDDIPASALLVGGGGSGGVFNPMLENLDGGGYNIFNVGDVIANSITAPNVVTNPLSIALDANNKDISNINNTTTTNINTNQISAISPATEISYNNNIQMAGYDILFPTNITGVGRIESAFDMYITGGPLYLRSSPSGTTGIYIDDNLNFQYPLISKILNCNEMKTTGQQLRLIGDPLHLENATGGTDILVSNPFNMNSQDIKDVADIGVQSISSLGDIVMNNSVDFNLQDLKRVVNINGVNGLDLNITNVDDPIVLTGSSIELRTNPPGQVVETYADLDMKSNDIKEVANVSNTSLDMLVGTGTGTLTLDGGTSRQLISSTQIQYFATRFEETNSQVSKIDTVHIYDASGFTETVLTLFGNDYYILKDNCTYIIHDQITVTNGFNFGINTAIKGESLACSITFDESTKDICGFRADNEHLFLSDITIIGGGGHFTSSTANVKGLFDFSNFNTGALPPFYGRNKRCRIQNVQIIAPYSLGKLQGGGTLRLLGNFINGGGAQPTGIYTRVGLEVSDGLSFEFCNNKVVLMAGAQALSTLKMLDFVDATLTPVVLGFNAVIVSGNIFHPRDQENGINFANNSITALGTIGANTFIRTGGTAPLINYERATIDNNYNKSAIINYEVNGNAGVIDVLPTCLVDCANSNNLSSATFIDITFPVGNILTLNGTKRFGLKSFVSGVTGGNYTTGNYIRDTANANNFAYILEATLIISGENRLILIDFNNAFTSATNYEEVDKDFVLTGVTSTAFNFGTTSNNECELYYFDKDPADLQITVGITHNNSTTNDEVQFAFAFDDGSGYVLDSSTTISVTNPRAAPRSNTSTISTLKRFVKGNQLKVQYRYIDTTTSVIDNLLLSVH